MESREYHHLLFESIFHRNVSLLQDLLNCESARDLINVPSDGLHPSVPNGNTLLHFAVEKRSLPCAKCLLDAGADPNIFDSVGSRTPLHLAIELGCQDIVEEFLSLSYTDLDLRDDRNLSCLEIAQLNHNILLYELVKKKTDESYKFTKDYHSLLSQACINNDSRLLRQLIDKYRQHISSRLPMTWKDKSVAISDNSVKNIINRNFEGSEVTLLFKAASQGLTDICKILIETGAVEKRLKTTNYSALYVAAYGGFCDTIKLLLDNFPSAISEQTIEGWTVLHACCLKNHVQAARLILKYTYPEEILHTFTSRSGRYEYKFAFDLNASDAAGQTALYLSVDIGSEEMLDVLLSFDVKAEYIEASTDRATLIKPRHVIKQDFLPLEKSFVKHVRAIPADEDKNRDAEIHISSTSKQLDKIMKQLYNLNTKDNPSIIQDRQNQDSLQKQSCCKICPFEVDTYCDYNSKSALHLAVIKGNEQLTTALLVHGANPNLPILTTGSSSFNVDEKRGLDWYQSIKSTCLSEACKQNNNNLVDALIRYNARDDGNIALQIAVGNQNHKVISSLLSLKSSIDSDSKINNNCNVQFASKYKGGNQKMTGSYTTTFSALFPSSSVILHWNSLKCIKHIDPNWMIEASLIHNKRLKNPTNSLLAITKVDLSDNNLKTIHPVLFRLPSLRELDLSKNKLETLFEFDENVTNTAIGKSTSKLIRSQKTALKRSKSSSISIDLETSNTIDLDEILDWDLPYLERLDVKENLLTFLPECLFELPRLREVDVSNNQIRQLPNSLWFAPSLIEVNASGNLLDNLPQVNQNSNRTLEESSYQFKDEFLSTSKELDKGDTYEFEEILDSNVNLPLEMKDLSLTHVNFWQRKVDIVNLSHSDGTEANKQGYKISKINNLNISHNAFQRIPSVLSCAAPNLTRLDISFNRLTDLGSPKLIPSKLKSLDVSHNKLDSWFKRSKEDTSHCHLYNQTTVIDEVKSKIIEQTCIHRIHNRLDDLKLLNLSYNNLKSLNLFTKASKNETGSEINCDEEILIVPNLTTLDVSHNQITSVTKRITALKDLSVLNLSNNLRLSSLPPEIGMLNKLWNLNITGCSFSDPLKSIIESKNCKMLDVIGYFRSILDESKQYARMKLMIVGPQGIGKTSLLEVMRGEGTSGFRRGLPEHWTKRMGYGTKSYLKNQRGLTLSTVGIDIHDWIFERKMGRNQGNSLGPVTFSTWDFGGQDEFYATHRYFLSKRSIYLVVWRLTDGHNALIGIQQWLVNIQSRAPGSPVIIVATHEDLIPGGQNSELVVDLQNQIKKKFISIMDPERSGLPYVMDSIVVSIKTKLNIHHLCNRIYDIVYSLRSPSSTERLLEQKIPATYLYLEEIIGMIVNDLRRKRKDPVVNYADYRRMTSDHLKSKYNRTFRDLEPINSKEINYNSELQQATRFLHDNGVLLHYDDANLRDLYFLDAQWLSDILAAVVSIREINPYVKDGLMRIDDLPLLYKSLNIDFSGGIQSYIVNLLNKFEVALTWNAQYLLIPSLLPSNPNDLSQQSDFQSRIKMKPRGRSVVRRWDQSTKRSSRSSSAEQHIKTDVKIEFVQQDNLAFNRWIFLRYLPAGFFARLQSAILSDPVFEEICLDICTQLSQLIQNDIKSNQYIGDRTSWLCWKSGLRMWMQKETKINHITEEEYLIKTPFLFELKETTISQSNGHDFINRDLMIEKKILAHGNSIKQLDDGVEIDASLKENSTESNESDGWIKFDTKQYANCIQIKVNNWKIRIFDGHGEIHEMNIDQLHLSRMLAALAEHVDSLLEDWYPTLGTRFVHTFGGNYLVARLVPCSKCLCDENISNAKRTRQSRQTTRRIINQKHETISCFHLEQCILNAYNITNFANTSLPNKTNFSLTASLLSAFRANSKKATNISINLETLKCPLHGSIQIETISPDIVFNDIPENYKISNESIERYKLIGRGAYGFVFKGLLKSSSVSHLKAHLQRQESNFEIALKLLQPVDPGSDSNGTDQAAFKSSRANWLREPLQSACKSYCTARHELNILLSLNHPNIVFFVGLTLRPLAIVLELAPLGSIDLIFKEYKSTGVRINQFSVQKTILQVAKALEYLHQQRVIYRDLKSENVLVWEYPGPAQSNEENARIQLKLADYGISRQALPSGIKGFGGTIGFLAPEILRHNGDEEYTEKVDCFSFGVFLYEMITLQPPFKQSENFRRHLFDNGRLIVQPRDLYYPSYILDLMIACCAQEPHNRPTASQIVSIAGSPEFMQLHDVVTLKTKSRSVVDSWLGNQFSIAFQSETTEDSIEIWFETSDDTSMNVISANLGHWCYCKQVNLQTSDPISSSSINLTACCVVNDEIWICDTQLNIHVMDFSLYCDNSVVAKKRQIDLNMSGILSQNNPIWHIKAMVYVNSANCILLLTSFGTIWLLLLSNMTCQRLDDGSITFTCIAVDSNSVSSVDRSTNIFKIWCGQSNGISCLEVVENLLRRQCILPITDNMFDKSGEALSLESQSSLSASRSSEISHIVINENLLWTSCSATIHLWDTEKRIVVRKLDCWRLVPCSESLISISIENYYEESQLCHITSLEYLDEKLFIGTSHGCFMVIEANSLDPITVFKPYLSNTRILIPMQYRRNIEKKDETLVDVIGIDNPETKILPKINNIVTIGTDYRSLMTRYVDAAFDQEFFSDWKQSEFAILWSANNWNIQPFST